jgi:hypothetical protein
MYLHELGKGKDMLFHLCDDFPDTVGRVILKQSVMPLCMA